MIDEISSLPIDLHVAGHTHGSQIFPLTLLMRGLAPLNYGAKVVGGDAVFGDIGIWLWAGTVSTGDTL